MPVEALIPASVEPPAVEPGEPDRAAVRARASTAARGGRGAPGLALGAPGGACCGIAAVGATRGAGVSLRPQLAVATAAKAWMTNARRRARCVLGASAGAEASGVGGWRRIAQA